MDQDQSGNDQSSKFQTCIQELLERHGVPERRRLNELCTVLELEYTQVRRRMKGETSFTADEVKKIATHYTEPLLNLLAAWVDEPGLAATFQFGGLTQPVTIWLAPRRGAGGKFAAFVAYQAEGLGQWTVVPSSEAGDRLTFPIQRMAWDSQQPRRVAVVDDDEDLAESIVQYLRLKGIDATPFLTLDKARAAFSRKPFDGYILDWMLGNSTVGDLLPNIRQKSPAGPIIVLTGKARDGTSEAEDLASVVSAYRAQLLLKPTSNLSLYSALGAGFEAPAR